MDKRTTISRQCLSCGHHEMLRNEDYQEHLQFNGESEVLIGLSSWFFPICGDGELDPESSAQLAVAHDELVHRARARQLHQ